MIFTSAEKYGKYLTCTIEFERDQCQEDYVLSIQSVTQAKQVEDELIRLVRDIAKWRLEQESKE